jgi:hypothetical protein
MKYAKTAGYMGNAILRAKVQKTKVVTILVSTHQSGHSRILRGDSRRPPSCIGQPSPTVSSDPRDMGRAITCAYCKSAGVTRYKIGRDVRSAFHTWAVVLSADGNRLRINTTAVTGEVIRKQFPSLQSGTRLLQRTPPCPVLLVRDLFAAYAIR